VANIPVIGVGGIFGAQDALQYLFCPDMIDVMTLATSCIRTSELDHIAPLLYHVAANMDLYTIHSNEGLETKLTNCEHLAVRWTDG
jgi:hypothetical protein